MKRFISTAAALVKTREFLVCLIVYPAVFFISIWIIKLLMPYVSNNTVMFGIISFAVAVLLIILTVMEIINRLMNHRIQGQHLAIRQRKGVEVPDGLKDKSSR